MNLRDFSSTFSVDRDKTPEDAFRAICKPREWWGQDIAGHSDTLDAGFMYRYKDIHRCKLRVTELVPGQRVVWRVLDNYFNFVQDSSEWVGTDIRFEIAESGGKTEIHFRHVGLFPEYECFDVCSNAWDFYINTRLRSLTASGHGQPNQK